MRESPVGYFYSTESLSWREERSGEGGQWVRERDFRGVLIEVTQGERILQRLVKTGVMTCL